MKSWQKNPAFRFFSSLRLAVFSILLLAGVLAVATVLESLYGMRGAHELVYGQLWFYGVLFLLGLNVLCAALSRYPWKKHQTGFVITHSGILLLLLGSWVTMQFGVDGNLPVVEGTQDSEVILNKLELVLGDPEERKSQSFPVKEGALKSEGMLLDVLLPGDEKLTVEKIYPRAKVKRVVASSPSGVGVPAVRVELFNDRFSIDEWIFADQVEGGRELNLGPAVLSLAKMWSSKDEKRFFLGSPQKISRSVGLIQVAFRGKEYRVSIEDALRKWAPLGVSGLELFVERYMPYAVVEKNQLVNKGSDPVNPTVQVRLREGNARPEKHTLFANFPSFATLHSKERKPGEAEIGAKLQMISAEKNEANAPSIRGRLFFAQSADNSKLLYRITGATEAKKFGQGEAEVGKAIPTGWMDLQFRVLEWIPAAVQYEKPEYVERLRGAETFPAAIEVVHSRPGREPSSADRHWLIEGSTIPIALGEKTLELRFQKERLKLPFQVFLKKFKMGTDPGTTKAATYESEVRVEDPAHFKGGEKAPEALISMNEPLHYSGFTLYQASYQMNEGAPPLSVFSVNQDPGRWIKYLGSIVMTLGILLMFYMNPHYWAIVLGKGKK